MTLHPTRSNRRRQRRGTILIVTIFIVFTLASLVLVMSRSTRVESLASANLVAAVQASAVERGAEQYVLSILTEQKDTLTDLTEEDFAAIPVGDGYFWIIRPDYGDNDLPLFGLTEEAAKLNINTATYDSLMKLPNMTDDVAAAIIDWRDSDDNVYQGGAEKEYYSSYGQYLAKNAPFETVEELMMVRGVTRDLLYGNGTAMPLGEQRNFRQNNSREMTDLQTATGLYDYLTVYSAEPAAAAAGGTSTGQPSSSPPISGGGSGSGTGGGATATGGKINVNDRNQRTALSSLLQQQLSANRANQILGSMGRGSNYVDVFDFYFQTKMKPDELDAIFDQITADPVTTGTGGTGTGAGGGAAATAAGSKGKINVNTAPRDVLLTLANLESADVDKVIAARPNASSSSTGSASIAWFADTLGKEKATGTARYVTNKTYQYSADIVAVSGNGRAFKRVRIVINASGTTPQVVYRRDLTDRGWPMDQEILTALRAGQGPGQWAAGARNTASPMSAGGTAR